MATKKLTPEQFTEKAAELADKGYAAVQHFAATLEDPYPIDRTFTQMCRLAERFAAQFTHKREKIKVGSLVFWNDPAIHDYPANERKAALDRVYVVQSIDEEEAWILEVGQKVGAETQVYPSELALVHNPRS